MIIKKILATTAAVALSACAFAVPAFAANISSAEDALVLSKTAQPHSDGTYTLTLEGYATGSQETIVTVKNTPLDIVLVLDESGSMDNCIKCGIDRCDKKESYQPIYLSKMDPAKASSYYYQTSEGSEYYKASYCSICKKWYQRTNHHNADGTHTGATRDPKTAEDSSGYQYYTYCEHEERYVSLNNAVSSFLESIYKDAKGLDGKLGTADDVTHRVAIVGFGDQGHLRSYVTGASANTGALGSDWKGATTDETALTKEQNADDYDSLNGYLHLSDWKNADGTLNTSRNRYVRMLRWANSTVDQANLAKALDAVGLDNGSTYTEVGLDAARAIFAFTNNPYKGSQHKDQNGEAYKDQNGRKRVVVLFTDGAPTHGSEYFSNANTAISYANDLKNVYDADVYTVGIFTGADASNPGTLPTYYDYSGGNLYPDSTNATRSAKGVKLANRFMQLVSSNYPAATAMENGSTGSLQGDGGYYLAASDSDELTSAFRSISESITEGGTTVTLDKTAVVKDIVEQSFYIPEGAGSVSAYSMTYGGTENGKEIWTKDSTKYTPSVSGRTVTVSGFDFAKNYVGMDSNTDEYGKVTYTPHGKKLVLEIKVKPNPDFLGGDNVPTNGTESGIYSGSTLVEAFDVPKVNIAVSTIAPKVTSKDIYLSQAASLPNVIGLGEYTKGGSDCEVDGINNAYADVVYTIEDPDGNKMTYTIPAGTAFESLTDNGWNIPEGLSQAPLIRDDTTYKITCTVTSNTNSNNTATPENPSTADVYVYKPEITFNDSEIVLGVPANYSDNGGADIDGSLEDDVRWLHGEGEDEKEANVNVMGAAPTLEYSYSPQAAAFNEDTDVKVTVTAKGNGTNVPADQDITQHVTFFRDTCGFKGCDQAADGAAKLAVSASDPDRVNFVVHVSTFDLTIAKTGIEQPLDDDSKRTIAEDDAEYQSTVFTITCAEDKDFSMKVAVHGNDSVTIKGLRVGSYTVTEDTSWSWRYAPKGGMAQTVTSSSVVDGKASITFENERKKDKWLSGDNWCANLFGSSGITKVTGAYVASGSGN